MSEKISANDVKNGDIIVDNGKSWQVIDREHVKPGKGPAYIQLVMKAIDTGTKTNKRFNSSQKVEKSTVEERIYQYSYTAKDDMVLMNCETCEMLEFPLSLLREQLPFLQEGLEVTIVTANDLPLFANLPDKLPAVIESTEPYIKGQTASASKKPAILTNGVKIMVPPFILNGEKIIVDTRNMTYVERYKEN